MTKKKEIVEVKHQHVKCVRGFLEEFGMNHLLSASHSNKSTQLAHDISIVLENKFEKIAAEKIKRMRRGIK